MPGMNFPYILEAALMAVVLLFSVIVHEVAHGYVALLNGDPTARIMGRITLNPVPHIDPVGTIILPLLLLMTHAGILFGWAKPVPVNPLNYRNYRWGEFAVSAAGPVSNLVLAVAFSVLLRLGLENPGLMQDGLLRRQHQHFPGPVQPDPHPAPGRLPHPGPPAAPGICPGSTTTCSRWGSSSSCILFYTGIMGAIIMPLYRQIALIMLG